MEDIDELRARAIEWRKVSKMTLLGSGDNKEIENLEKQAGIAERRRDKLIAMFEECVVTKENAATINKKLTAATNEYNELTGRLDAALALHGPSPTAIEDVVRFARSIRTIGAALGDDISPADKRIHCSTWIKEIRRTGDRWLLTLNLNGSSNCTVWLRYCAIDEPFEFHKNGLGIAVIIIYFLVGYLAHIWHL